MITIKEPTIEDSEGIKSIFLEKHAEDFVKTLPPEYLKMARSVGIKSIMRDMTGPDHDEMMAGFVDDFLAERNRCLIMERYDKVIGYCIASTEIKDDFGKMILVIGIGEIFIKKDKRRRGFGSRLLREFINKVSKEEECTIITVLDEEQYDPAVVGFFEKNGFVLDKLSYKKELGKKNYSVDHHIRKALPGDYEGYKELVINMYESFKSFDENIYHGTEVVYSQRYYLHELSMPNCLQIVCEVGNDIAGICMIDWDRDGVNIHTVSVAEKHANKGIATALYHSAFNFAIEKGYPEITAVVFAQNKASCKFHEHMLMQPLDRRYTYK
ncbi:MAG: GNAT family N-acetyltransferase [Clostridiales bacterium]|jgi:L-amino acid N-acyltransferase YncA|nr:GNAT family N-acetyltransferase [Clostridiales bacterium]